MKSCEVEIYYDSITESYMSPSNATENSTSVSNFVSGTGTGTGTGISVPPSSNQ